MTRRMIAAAMALLAAAAGAPSAAADEAFRLHGLFRDNLVIQCERPARVFGWAPAGKTVTVELAGQTVRATADDRGRFLATLEPLKPGGGLALRATCEGSTLTCANVAAGEVWLASGQSNMQVALSRAGNAEEVVPTANHPDIRFFVVPRLQAAEPLPDVAAEWRPVTPEAAPHISALAFFFARELHKTLHRPVGIIEADKGASYLREWMNDDALTLEMSPAERAEFRARQQKERPQLAKTLAEARRYDLAFEELMQKRLAAAEERTRQRRLEKDVAAEVTAKLGERPNTGGIPAARFNAMVAPLTGFALRGVIWYQGEWDAWMRGLKAEYAHHFRHAILGWRKAFGEENLPFLFVQLQSNHVFGGKNYPLLREAQRQALALPHTGMAVTLDVAQGLHPGNKIDPARRLAAWALGMVYGRDVAVSGPLFKSAAASDRQIRVSFEHVGEGLVVHGGGRLVGFELAGPDGTWHPAEARIDGQTVVVTSKPVEKPAHVRYLYQAETDGAEGLLYNRAGLPASPFTTEDVLVPGRQEAPIACPPPRRCTSSGAGGYNPRGPGARGVRRPPTGKDPHAMLWLAASTTFDQLYNWARDVIVRMDAWDAVGFVGQFVFFLRFVVQWIATERRKRTVVPIAFWYLSLAGSLITLVYAVAIKNAVFICAFSLNMMIYLRNLYFIFHRHQQRLRLLAERRGGLPRGEDTDAPN